MRASPFRRIDETQAAPATPETIEAASRFRYDVIGNLAARGRLHPHHVGAAEEIRYIIEGLVRAQFRARELDRHMPGVRGESRNWLVGLNEGLRRAWLRQYVPWKYQMAENCGCGTVLELVLEIVMENRGLGWTEKMLKIPRGSAISHLRKALDAWPAKSDLF